ncbi:hypothetical protein [Azospirillum rugosum]|uniref:Uncharacterized protein n=1 Tax=Azospirillum rugosum TaxID=416170 RepID=A0ABS4SJJ3_9PROT|nr:hypothetical protein [Azospirillum rugosum]MBP2292743.1 hypothetical protein [Azospirillum rugosum]MDQ0527002.1 hypothetical protein [Azospirillum rugosum]
MHRIQYARIARHGSVTPSQLQLDHENLTQDVRRRFYEKVGLLERAVVDLSERMADIGHLEVVNRGDDVSVLFRPHHAEGIHSLVGNFDMRLTHDGQVALRMLVRSVMPPAEILPFDRMTDDRLRARLSAFETECRRQPHH